MVRVEIPSVPEVVKPSSSKLRLPALLRACSGQDFESRRDAAIIRLLVDTGVRVSGLAGLRFSAEDDEKTDVFLHLRRLRGDAQGQGPLVGPDRPPGGPGRRPLSAGQARPRGPPRPWLWLAVRSSDHGEHFTDTGMRQMAAWLDGGLRLLVAGEARMGRPVPWLQA
jgi:integrase/recombinase XerD